MFIVLWVVLGGILGTCAAYMLIAGLQLGRKADVTKSSWHHALYGDEPSPAAAPAHAGEVSPSTP